MANRTKLTERARGKFIAILATTCNVSEAARAIRVSRQRLYEYRTEDVAFCAAWDEAVETAVDALEREARRRALEGWPEPVFYQGKKVGAVTKYSDRMLEVLLRAHRPEKFREPTAAAIMAMGVKGADGQAVFAILQVGEGPSRMIDLLNPDLSSLSELEVQAVRRLQAPKEGDGPEGSGRPVQQAEEGGRQGRRQAE